MSIKFSIVIPTRHRPDFVRQSLRYISLQTYTNYEVIVSDNYSDSSLTCKNVFDEASIPNSIYVKPLEPIGMVENWNFALGHAQGDYVLFLTDKMFLLPQTLERAQQVLSKVNADIVSWVDDTFTPSSFSDYFGEGYYAKGISGVDSELSYKLFDPELALSIKGSGEISRSEQDRSTYSRGKICFGAYSKKLISNILGKRERLFTNISPDYTSMILALSEAKVCVEIAYAGIVHLNTDLSNGYLTASSDTHAKGYIDSLEHPSGIYTGMLIKGLYSSVNNMMTHDYGVLKRKYNLTFDFNVINWLVYIFEDIFSKEKVWSSKEVEKEQKSLYQKFTSTLSLADQEILQQKISNREEAREVQKRNAEMRLIEVKDPNIFKRYLKIFIPGIFMTLYHKIRKNMAGRHDPPGYYKSLYEAVVSNK